MSKAIGVFDSGLGGLSVLREMQEQLAHENLIYVADSAHAPYGAKTAEYIAKRCIAISEFLLTQEVKLIVVACNTATAYAVEVLREQVSVPIVGLEPAVKPAVKLTKNGRVGVLATAQTASSERLKRLIANYAEGVEVIVQPCPGLVEHVEGGDFGSLELRALLQRYLAPLQAQNVDTLVLGCTHYPFLLPTLRELTAGHMTILETSKPVTRQVLNLLAQQTRAIDPKPPTVTFYSSLQGQALQASERSARQLWQRELKLLSLPTEYL